MPYSVTTRSHNTGIQPFIIRPPTNPDVLKTWIYDHEFEQLPEEDKEAYARKFGFTDSRLKAYKSKKLPFDHLFTQFNKRLPMFVDILEYGVFPHDLNTRVLLGRYPRGIDPYAGQKYSGEPSEPNYAPWLPSKHTILEKLGPSEDDFEDGIIPSATKPAEPAEHEQEEPAEYTLEFPPRPPVIGKDENGRDIYRPFTEDWLHVMLAEQVARHEALKSSLQNALVVIREASTEVSMLQFQIKTEQTNSDKTIEAIRSIAGVEVVKKIEAAVEYGLENGVMPPDSDDSDDEDQEEDEQESDEIDEQEADEQESDDQGRDEEDEEP